MTTLFDCALNGVLLSSLDDRICVLDLREDAPKLRTTTLSLYPEGQQLRQQRESLTLHVDFAIHEESPIRRKELLQALHAWGGQGGLLTTSDRPGQQLAVLCTALPAITAENWTEKLTLTFQSAGAPYWEDEAALSVTGDEMMRLTLPGTADASPVDAMVVNSSTAVLSSLTLHAGSTRMTFEGLSFQPGSVFMLTQSDGPLIAQVDGESVLPCRTADSADRLLLPCGRESAVYVSAEGPLTATFTARGRYA